MPQNNYSVYKHTAPNGKVYIGITRQDVNKRWKNGAGYVGCTAFYRAILKYGWDNISHEIIISGLSETEACALEIELIALYQSADPEYGYNLTHGGAHYTPSVEWCKRASAAQKRHYKAHPEHRAQISEQQKGRKASPQTKEKMSVSRRAYLAQHPEAAYICGSAFRGKKRSPENVEKLRVANRTRIRCIQTGAVFASVENAALYVGVSRSAISNNLTGRSKSAGGLQFEYVEDDTNAN